MTDTIKLQNDYKIPALGFGTWQTPNGEVAIEAVKTAIEAGYKHLDCAAAYGNEKSVGQGIKAAGISREDLFITSKVWNKDRGYEKTKSAFYKTIDDLGLEYLDLYLIHWPANKKQFDNWKELNAETWRAMEDLYKDGKIRSIGVSNFLGHHIEALLESATICPMVNQIEFHPGCLQEASVNYCKSKDILIEAWSPLGSGEVLKNQTLKVIADQYKVSIAQLCIKWVLQKGHVVLPKSVTPARIRENIQLDFLISEDDMAAIDQLQGIKGSGLNPDTVDF